MNPMAEDAEDTLLAEDARNRLRALELASFIVEAPAGAGKTELLTQRYLRLLAQVGEPEEIVAITFTNKAAAEMRNRILASLERAASGVMPAEAHKRITFELAQAALAAGAQRGWRLREQPQRLRIFTIDALCASLARQMPFLSRFGAQPRISDAAERHYAEAARRTIGMLADEGAHADVVAEALRHYDNNTARLTDLLASMLARRDQWLRHCVGQGPSAEAEAGLAALVLRDLQAASARLDGRLQGLLMPAARYAAANLPADSPLAPLRDWSAPLPLDAAALPQWRALYELVLTGTGTLRKQVNVRNGFPPGKESEPFKKALSEALAGLGAEDAKVIARIRRLPEPRYTEAEWRTVEVMAQLLKLAAVQLWAVFNEAGEADFVEVAQRALQALGAEEVPSDLALRLDYRIQHLLVDEFQDTSPLQIELLQRLTAGWQEGDGRTLFTVGDPMQSIYRFRKADVGLFLSAATSGIGHIRLQPLRLYRNNRSCAAVVDWINRGFAHIFPLQDSVTAGAIRYRPFSAGRGDLDDAGNGVFVHPLVAGRSTDSEAGAEDGEALDRREAACVLDIIRAERRVAPERRIAVLVRARSHLDALVAQIRREQPALRFQAVEIESLAARQPVQDLLALTRALLHRADRVHALAVLRAPWCGLTLADLHTLAADDQQATIWQLMNDDERVVRLSVDGQQRLRHVRAVLGEAYAQQGRVRLRRWVEGVWLKLGGATCLAQEGDVADVRAYLDLLDALDGSGRFSLDRLADEVAELYAAPDAQADGSLQFMTIHKSKGLEFDTVILPGLQRKGRGDEHALMLWEEVALDGLEECLVAAPYGQRAKGQDDASPTPYDYLRLLEQERSANEAMRVLYVAATRAIRRLHLVGVARCNKDGEVVPAVNSFLQLLWQAEGVAGDFRLAAEDSDISPLPNGERAGEREITDALRNGIPLSPTLSPVGGGEGVGFIPRLVRLAEPKVPELLRAEPRPMATFDDRLETAEAETESGDRLAADVGTLLHAYLELIAGSDLATWNDARIAALQPAMVLWFNRQGHGGTAAQDGARRVAAALATTLASAEGRWLLAPHTDSAAELALTNLEHEHGRRSFVSHVVDRCFVADGVRWIVDYKTARVGDGDINVAALCAHAERYRPQLERYARLFAEEGLTQRLAIFYASHGELVVLE